MLDHIFIRTKVLDKMKAVAKADRSTGGILISQDRFQVPVGTKDKTRRHETFILKHTTVRGSEYPFVRTYDHANKAMLREEKRSLGCSYYKGEWNTYSKQHPIDRKVIDASMLKIFQTGEELPNRLFHIVVSEHEEFAFYEYVYDPIVDIIRKNKFVLEKSPYTAFMELVYFNEEKA